MKKSYIIIIAIFAIYAGVMIFFFGIFDKDAKEGTYLVIGNNTRWTYQDGEWKDIEEQDNFFDKNKFQIYKDFEYKGDYYMQYYNDTWYFFDDNNSSHNLYGELVAYYSENPIDVLSFKIEELTSVSEINNLIKEYDVSIESLKELSVNQKVSIDIDNDGELEHIYSLSNLAGEEEGSTEYTFSILLYEDNQKIEGLHKNVSLTSSKVVENYYLISNFIDINNNQDYEMIIEKSYPLSIQYNCHMMYQLKNKKFQSIKSC